jgi:outer membrane protein, multidrug efflux system
MSGGRPFQEKVINTPRCTAPVAVPRASLAGDDRMIECRSRTLVVLALLNLAGCVAAGPDYRAPAAHAPTEWTALQPEGHPALTSATTVDLATWWKRLGDPMLSELIETALRTSPDIERACARIRQARAQRAASAAGAYPQVTASGDGRKTNYSGHSGSDATVDLYDVGFDASWELDIFGGVRRGVEATNADLQASEASLAGVQVSLAAEVATSYVEARAQQTLISIARDNLASQTETLQLTEWRAQAGLTSVQDVEQARTNRERTRAQIPTLETSLAESEHRLDALLGLAPGTLHTRLDATNNEVVAPEGIAVGIPADTLRQRPDVRVAERNLAAETARVGVAAAALYPSFTISGSIGLEALTLGSLGDGNAGVSSLVAGLTAPLLEGGRLRAQVAAQEAVRDQALADYRQTVLTALEDVENALVALEKNRERDVALKSAVDSARLAATLARERYTVGLIDFESVLDTARTVLTAEESLARTSADGLQALVRLYKSLGGGWSPMSETPATAKDAS